MSTNFCSADAPKGTDHIGKRSAAGLYCWDCGVTLCRGGNEAIHLIGHHATPYRDEHPRRRRAKP